MSGQSVFWPRSVAGVTLAQAVALFLPCAVDAFQNPSSMAVLLSAALLTALIWEAVFAVSRKHALSIHGVTTALIVSVMVPPDLAVWQLVIAVSLGVVLGELVFGGRGFGFIDSATVALSLLVISFPQVALAAPTQELAIATLPGALLLLALGLISWRVIVAVSLAGLAAFAAGGFGFDLTGTAIALAFGLVFLICEPTSAAATTLGRWIYGALAGGLLFLFSPGGQLTPEAVVFASLMASVFAPMIDHLVVLAHTRRRERRHA